MVKDKKKNKVKSGSSARSKLTSFNDTSNATAFRPAAAPKMRVKEEDDNKADYILDSVARVFHPTSGGHQIIAYLILYKMEAVRAGVYNSMASRKYGNEWS